PDGGSGTGFFVAPGWVLTCAHVVRSADRVTVTPDRSVAGAPVEATVEARSAPPAAGLLWPFPDLALLHLEQAIDHPCVLLEPTLPTGDQECYAWGFSEREPSVTPPGSPASFRFEGVEADGYLKLKAGEAAPGLSGAPLVC